MGACLRGDVAAAVDQALDIASRVHDDGLVAFEVIAAHDAVRLGAADRAAEQWQAAAAQAEGPYPAVCAEHAAVAVSGDGEGLLTVADRFAELQMLLHAAEAAAQAAAAFRADRQAALFRAAKARAWSFLGEVLVRLGDLGATVRGRADVDNRHDLADLLKVG